MTYEEESRDFLLNQIENMENLDLSAQKSIVEGNDQSLLVLARELLGSIKILMPNHHDSPTLIASRMLYFMEHGDLFNRDKDFAIATMMAALVYYIKEYGTPPEDELEKLLKV